MKTRYDTSFTALVVVTLSCFAAARPAGATTITMQLAGTYDVTGDAVFGESGPAVPFSYSLTYDTGLGAQTAFLPAGTSDGSGGILQQDLYGYSAGGIVASSLTFGTHSWATSALVPWTVWTGVTADFWVDADLTAAPPTLLLAEFIDHEGVLTLGIFSGDVDGSSLAFDQGTLLFGSERKTWGEYTLTVFDATPVPEPASLVLFGGGLVAAAARLRRSKQQ